jgi:hypothetical protein
MCLVLVSKSVKRFEDRKNEFLDNKKLHSAPKLDKPVVDPLKVGIYLPVNLFR